MEGIIGKASKDKTGRLIEFQSGNPNTEAMIGNAERGGYSKTEVEVIEVTQAELDILIPKPTEDDRKEAILNAPGFSALIETLEDKFPMLRGALRQKVKDRII